MLRVACRLLDAGKTDYSQYALHEKEMTSVPGQKDCFNHKGRVLRLIGMNRQNPRRLIDDYTKEVHLWKIQMLIESLCVFTACPYVFGPRGNYCSQSLITGALGF